VGPEGREIEKELLLDPGLVVAGAVTSEDGAPIPGAAVRVEGTPDDPKVGAFVRRGTADDRGRFRVSGLPPGRYVARVSASGFTTTPVEGLRGGEQSLVVRLARRP
jgi:iron complex outermembrane receptor protein